MQLPEPLNQIVPRGTIDKLLIYRDLLVQWQKTINLVAPSTLNDAWDRHFVDSLQLLPIVGTPKTLVDMGSGAGFPGLVLATALPDTHVHLVESDARKCAFLLTVAGSLQLKNVTVHTKRIEQAEIAGPVDCVTARALAPLADLIIWSQHFTPTKRVFPKGRGWAQELEIAQKNTDCSTWNIFESVTEPDARIIEIS